MTAPPVVLLVVCTGNICRSPMGELILAQMLQSALGPEAAAFRVSSAGTYDGHAGEPMQPGAVATMRSRGIDPAQFTATALDPHLVASADAVLTAEPSHRSTAIGLHPASASTVFTIKEFGRLANVASAQPETQRLGQVAPSTRAQILIAAMARLRGSLGPIDPNEDRVDDPYGAPVAAFERVANEMEQAFLPFIQLLAPPITADGR